MLIWFLQNAAAQDRKSGQLREFNPPASPPAEKLTAIAGVRLIDGRGGAPVEDAVVVIRGDRIVEAGKVPVPTAPNSYPGRACR